MAPFRVRPWRLFFGIVGSVFLATAFVALVTYDDDNVPSFEGQDALFTAVALSAALLVGGALVRAGLFAWSHGRWGRPERLRLAAGVAAVLVAGLAWVAIDQIRSHREFDAARQASLAAAWQRLHDVCHQEREPGVERARVAAADMHTLVLQFADTPDARTRFGPRSEPRSMRELLRSLTDPRVIPPGQRCVGVTGGAHLALDQEAADQNVDPPGPPLARRD